MLAGIGLFGLLDANNKLLSAGHPVWQVLLVRFAALLLAVWLARRIWPGWGGPLTTRFPRLHALRAVVMLGSAICFFQAFSRLPLAEGYLVFFTSPFLVLLLSAWLLGERPRPAAWAWCAVGFGGVALGLAPGLAGAAGGPLLGYAYALGGTLCYSAVFILNRKLRGEPGIGRVLVWPSLLGLAVMAVPGVASWTAPTALSLAQMLGNGLLVGAATVALAEAFRHADAARLAPFGYSGLVWSLGWDFLIWGLVPGGPMLAGAALVVFACIMSERAATRPA
ncbi:DMT family transporter [Roseomonas sp. BU-1]|uniref:DMT family transporter n=2 Tax=Falsiroseomonas selenitidurans TaxID=2716335 RepID=A0ABX1E714_9PROT|nr:DMT family transporter [Falsiroseomonas selenitidurans]